MLLTEARQRRNGRLNYPDVRLMKLATWNLELPLSARRRKTIRSHTDREQADVWVLGRRTTTSHPAIRSPTRPPRAATAIRGMKDRWVTIWSRYPLEALETSDDKRTAAARLTPTLGEPFVVYGVTSSLGSAANGEGTQARGESPFVKH